MEEKAYNLALKFLSYRPRSEHEVRERLKKKKVENPLVEKIISKLKEKRFINDEEFVRWWIESRINFKHRSIRLIKLELKQKGIDQELIERMINDKGLMINDLDQAEKLTEKRIKRYKDLPKNKIYEKLGRYLASKGFNWDTIKRSIDAALAKGV